MQVIMALIPFVVIAAVVLLFSLLLKGKAFWKNDDGAFATGQVAKAIIFWGILSGFYLAFFKILPGDASYVLRGQIPRETNMEEISTDTSGLYIRPMNTTFRWVYAPVKKPEMKDWALKFNYELSRYEEDREIKPGPTGELVEKVIQRKVPKLRGSIYVCYSKKMDKANEIQIELQRDPDTREPKADESGKIICEPFCDNVPISEAVNLTGKFLPDFSSPAYAQSHSPLLAMQEDMPFQQQWQQRLEESDLTLRQFNQKELIYMANHGLPYESPTPLLDVPSESRKVIDLVSKILSTEQQPYMLQIDTLYILNKFKPSLKQYVRLNKMLSEQAIYTILSLMLSLDPTAQETAFPVLAECVNDEQSMDILSKYIQFLEPRLEPNTQFDRDSEEDRINYLRLARASGFMIWAAKRADRQGDGDRAIEILEDAAGEAASLLPWAKENDVTRPYVARPFYELAATLARHSESPEEIEIAKDRFQEFIRFVSENDMSHNYSAAFRRATEYMKEPILSSLNVYGPEEYRVRIFVWGGSGRYPLVRQMQSALKDDGFGQVIIESCELRGGKLVTRSGFELGQVPYYLQISYSRPAFEYDMAKRVQAVVSGTDPEFAGMEIVHESMKTPSWISIFFPPQIELKK
jgi:hypothetical protein